MPENYGPSPDTDQLRRLAVEIATQSTRLNSIQDENLSKRVGVLEVKMAVIQVKLGAIVFIAASVASVLVNVVMKQFGG